MNNKGPGKGFLVIIVILFGISVGVLQGLKKHRIASPSQSSEALTIDDTINYITPLIVSRSFDKAAQAILQFNEPMTTIKQIITNPTGSLSDEERVALLLNVVVYTQDEGLHDEIFSLIKKYYATHPIFLIAVDDHQEKVVPTIIKWGQENDGTLLDDWIEASFERAVANNNVDALQAFSPFTIRPDKETVNKYLHRVVREKKDVRLVPILVKQFGANADYSDDNKTTLLILAIKAGDVAMVEALLDAGAGPVLMLNGEVGDPAQVAFEKGISSIMELIKRATHKLQVGSE